MGILPIGTYFIVEIDMYYIVYTTNLSAVLFVFAKAITKELYLLSDAETKVVLIISVICCLDNKLATNI